MLEALRNIISVALIGASTYFPMNSVANPVELENTREITLEERINFEKIYNNLPKPHLDQYMEKNVLPSLDRREDLENRFHIDISLRGYDVNDFKMFSGQRVPFNRVNFESLSDSDWLLRNLIVSSEPSDRMALYREAGQIMSFDSQIQFISKLGLEMFSHYDHERADAGISANEAVDGNDILDNLETSNDMGVCRDIVMNQAQILEGMGNKGNVYGLSFAVPGSMHMALLATDPNNPNRIHKINGNQDSIEEEQLGIAALSQDESPDVGITYRVWRPDGKMISSLPSQMGLVLNEMTGGVNNQDYDPFIRQDYDIAQIYAGYGSVNGRIFATNLSNGDPIHGVATNIQWELDPEEIENVDFSGHIGVAYAHRNTSATDRITGITTYEYDLNQAYLNFQQRIGVLVDVQNFTINPYADFRLQVTSVEGGIDKKRSWTGDGDITLDTGVDIDLKSNDKRTSAIVSMYTQTTLGLDDVRALLGANVIPVINHSVISADVEHAISPYVKLNAGFLYAFREYGDSMLISAGASFDQNRSTTIFNVGLYTPTTEQQHGWMPGGARTSITTSIQQSLYFDDEKSIDLGIDYIQSLEDNNFNLNSWLRMHFLSK